MRLDRRSFVILGAACMWPGSRVSSAVIGGRVEAGLSDLIQHKVPKGFSGSVLVAKGNRLLLHRGFGTIGHKAIRRSDRFWISSTAKQFVSAAILKLADQNRLKLSDSLSRFFPGVAADKAGITVHQLLSHMSGFGQSYVGEKQPSHDSAVFALLAEPLVAVPGQGFRYSNANFDLAAAIVETVSGMAFAEFVRSQLWAPANLTRTGFAGPETSPHVCPVPGGIPSRLKVESWGEHGVFSSTADLFHWYRALNAGRIISPAAVGQLFGPVAKIGEGHAGLGWFIGSSPAGKQMIFTRGNDDFGPNSLIYAYPERKIVIVVLTHAGDADDETSWSRSILAEIQSALNL